MHANPIPLQNLSALCNILITAVQRLNHWLCHGVVCFSQVSVGQAWNDVTFALGLAFCFDCMLTCLLHCSFKELSAVQSLRVDGFGQDACA